MQGTIKFYNDQKGFGFIVPENGDDDMFFHVSNCAVGYLPQQDDVVTYEIGEGRDGRATAIEVAPVTGGAEEEASQEADQEE